MIKVNKLVEDGFRFLQNGKLEDARDCFDISISYNIHTVDAYAGLSEYWEQKEELDQAINCIDKALLLEPSNPTLLYLAGTYHRKNNAHIHAIAKFKQAIHIDPNYATALNDLTAELYLVKNFIEAEKCAKHLTENFTGLPAGHYVLAQIYQQRKQFKIAAEEYKRYLNIESDDDQSWYDLGCIYYQSGDADNAILCFDKVVELNGEYAEAWNFLGALLKEKGALEEAKSCFIAVHSIDPTDHVCIYNLGVVYAALKDDDKAIECYKRVLELKPEHGSSVFNIGLILGAKGLVNEEIFYYRQALTIDKNCALALAGLGKLSISQGNFEQGLDYLEKAESLEHYAPAIYFYLFQIPHDINPLKHQHFLRFLYTKKLLLENVIISEALPYLFSIDAPMLIDRLMRDVQTFDLGFYGSIAGQLGQNYNRIKKFKQLFVEWTMDGNVADASIGKAICHFLLGDPLTAFEILSDEVDERQLSKSPIALYYLCQSSYAISENIERNISYAKKQLITLIRSQPSDEAIYYAGLLHQLCGEDKDAIILLRSIKGTYPPALYKLAELYYEGNYPNWQESRLVIILEESVSPRYQFGIRAIFPDHSPSLFLEQIKPIIHFLECEQIVAHIFQKPLEIKNAFSALIMLDNVEPIANDLTLAQTFPRLWEELTSREYDQAAYDLEISRYQVRNPLMPLTRDIMNGVKAELLDHKEGVSMISKYDFKLYLRINHDLCKNELITLEDASEVVAYIYYCASKLPSFQYNKFFKFLLETCLEYVVSLYDGGYSFYIQKSKALYMLIHEEVHGKNSSILNFNDFKIRMISASLKLNRS